MKASLVIFLMCTILMSCSTPRYTYYFDRQQINTGKSATIESRSEFILPTNQAMLTASTSNEDLPMEVNGEPKSREIENGLSVTERGERKAHLVESKAKTRMSIPQPPSQKLDRNLKLSILFGGSGIVGLIIGGSFFLIVGSISLLVGIILFIKWLVRK